MKLEDELLNLLLFSPNSEKIKAIAQKLELNYNFAFSNNRIDLQGVWELRRSTSNSTFLKYSPSY